MKKLLLYILIYGSLALNGQTLVLNGDHEDFLKKPSVINLSDSCYREMFQVGVTPPILNPPNPPGIASACGSADHLCTNPNTGKAHGGFFVSAKFENPEYQLCFPLGAGYKYRTSVNIILNKESQIAIDQFGFWFTDWGYKSPGFQIQETPDYRTPVKEFIINKDIYKKYGFEFTSKGGETALILGNFIDSALPGGSNTTKLTDGTSNNAYYYVDGIEVVPVPELPDSVIVCKGEKAMIAPENYKVCNGTLPVKWFDVANEGNIISENDTLVISTDNDVNIGAIIGVDTLFTKIIVKTPSFTNPLPGEYTFCQGDSLLLNAMVNGNMITYGWNTGESTAVIKIGVPGIYSVNISDGECSLEFETSVVLMPATTWNIEQDTFSICENGTVTFNVDLNPGFELVSSDGQIGKSFTFSNAGNYTFSLKPLCGNSFVDTITILDTSFDPDKRVLIPNVFTPNGDNRNDVFKVIADKALQEFELSIFNRWGKKVFVSTSPALVWDGKINGEPAPSEVYIYSLKCMVDDCGKAKKVERKGDVTLIR